VDVSIPGSTIPLPFDYEDGWFFSVGAEFDVTQHLTLRGGVGYELSPLDDDTRTFRLPDSDRLWLSAGASYQEADLVSAAAGGPPGNGPFSGEADSHVHILAAAVKVRLGALPAPAP
jgi:long-chain fatty acid transport protein